MLARAVAYEGEKAAPLISICDGGNAQSHAERIDAASILSVVWKERFGSVPAIVVDVLPDPLLLLDR